MAGQGIFDTSGKEGETLPKEKTSKAWLAHADSLNKKFTDYHSERNIFGQIKNPRPLSDDYSKLLSDKELQARKMGMELLRKETKEEAERNKYARGGKVGKSGPATLHKGEAVVRKAKRSKPRSSSR